MLKLLKPYGDPELERKLVNGLVEVVGLDEREPVEREKELRAKLAEANLLMGDVDVAVTEKLLEGAPSLRAVICRSIGVDFVDVEAATRRGILVLNSPLFCVTAVAEYALALMLSVAHRLPEAARAMDAGAWCAREDLRGMELTGKTLGLIGCGRIGRELMRMARIAYDPYLKDLAGETILFPLRQVLEMADVVSIHSPLTPDTKGLLGAEQFAWMKPGAILINVSRGGIVDECALHAALKSRRLAGAALDVLAEEPPGSTHCLYRAGLDNLILTPHAAWNTREGHSRNQDTFYRQILMLSKGQLPEEGIVNPAVARNWKLNPSRTD